MMSKIKRECKYNNNKNYDKNYNKNSVNYL